MTESTDEMLPEMIGERTGRLFTMVEDLATLYSPDDETLIRAVKLYANAFARFALARAQMNLFRSGNYSAARAVEAQVAVLEALEKAV